MKRYVPTEMETTQDHIKIARSVATAIGLEPKVYPYYDEDETTSIDILSVVDPLDKNINIHCSIGISNYPNIIEMKNGNSDISIELLITANKKFAEASSILSTCGFYIIKNQWTCQPGSVYKNIVNMYYPQVEMKHILFTRPYLWADKLSPFKLENTTVHFLLCIPISEKELEYKEKCGTNALEKSLFQDNNIDIFDLKRFSIF